MRFAILVFLALLGGIPFAHAAEVVGTIDGVVITLSDQPCDGKVKALLKPEYHAQFQGGRAAFPDRTLQLCWAIHPQTGAIFILDEEGDTGSLPPALFAPRSSF